MDFVDSKAENATNPDYSKPRARGSVLSRILNKTLFFLVGASVTCIGSTGWITSKAFETDVFISDCFSVYFYLNLAAFLVVLLFIDCKYPKAIVCGWICVLVHVCYILISAFATGNVGKYLYVSVYAGIAVLEAFVIQSNSHVISNYYDSTIFSNMYSGYYGGVAIFALIQTLVQYVVGTDTSHKSRLCLLFTHLFYGIIVLFAVVAQTKIYMDTRDTKSAPETKISAIQSCVKKLRGMFHVLRSLPKYSSRFTLFIVSDLCKCAFYQVFIPYRMLLNDTELTIVFFITNISDIIGRTIASSADDTVVVTSKVKHHQRFLYGRDIIYYALTGLCWVFSFLIVFATWTLKMGFLTKFGTIVTMTLVICFAVGYCSTRGMNGCIPVLEYFNKNYDVEGQKMTDLERSYYSYVNDLNAFMIKLLWMFVFLGVYFLAARMETHQSTEYYQNLKKLL